MASMTYRQSPIQPKPPEKGSFPLDHEGACKNAMIEYMTCLKNCEMDNGRCRELSKEYLNCRMEKGLMAKDEWKNLGFKSVETTKSSETLT